MFKQKLTHELVALMPCSRRYGRALLGDPNLADELVVAAAKSVIRRAPSLPSIIPSSALLPWLYIELHRKIDSGMIEKLFPVVPQQAPLELPLHEKIDIGLLQLSDIQKRVYLLTTLDRFPFSVTARVLSIAEERVRQHFQEAHTLMRPYADH